MTTYEATPVCWHYVIKAPRLVTYAGFETASAWSKRVLLPGAYPVRFEIDHGFTPPLVRDAHVAIAAVEIESYWENRLLTAVSADHQTELRRPTTHHLHWYSYQIAAAKPGDEGLSCLWTATQPERPYPADEEIEEYIAEALAAAQAKADHIRAAR